MLCAIFFFNDTSTTEIYTYGHTLSLHDALPILLAGISRGRRATAIAIAAALHGALPAAVAMVLAAPFIVGSSTPLEGLGLVVRGSDPVRFGLIWMRSEEHTSELQSLMRISYAVFCLNTKKTK